MMNESGHTIVIVENRAMIRDLLVDILGFRGYTCLCADALTDSQPLLTDARLALLMVDVGLSGGWEATRSALARIPELGRCEVLLFACAESLGGPGVHLLRSPRDFSAIADAVELRLTPTQHPRLGELLVEAGALTPSALQAVLAVQEEAAKLGRRPLLGQFLVSLGFVSQADVTRALRTQDGKPAEDEAV
jgi:CheY-like chemotaxis protein